MSASKVTFIGSAAEMGGVEFSTLYLASHLNPGDWEPVVVCPKEGRLASACRDAGVSVKIISMPHLFSTSFRVSKRSDVRFPNPFSWVVNFFSVLVGAWRLNVYLSHEKPDIVVTKGMYAHFCGGLAAKVAGIKCVWHVQDFISERFFGIYRVIFGILARLFPDVIAVDGGSIARQLPAQIRSRVSLVFNGVDIQIFRPGLDGSSIRKQLAIASKEIVIGHAARITPWKGQHHLLEAFGKVACNHPEMRLLFVGAPIFDNDGYDQRLRTRVDELKLNHRVIFAGFRPDLANVLSAMDIFAYPSLEKDTSPLALLSAMACGLPILAFDIEGVREVIDESGMLIPVGDDNKMADALDLLVRDISFRNQLANRSREKAVRQFSLERYVVEMEAVLLRGLA